MGHKPRRRRSAKTMQRFMRFWAPFLGLGLRIDEISADWSVVRVSLPLTRWNRNQMGTAYGAGLFAMTDAFHVLMLMNRLGKGYLVWDSRAEIEYVRPGTGTVYGTYEVDDACLHDLREAADRGEKVLHWFDCDLVNDAGQTVARVRRQVYVRKKSR